MSVYKCFAPLALLIGAGFLTGCGQSVTQKDVNEERREAAKVEADAQKKTQEVRHEVRKEVTDIDQDRRDKVAELRTEIQTNPDANAPKLQAKIAETNREADRKIADIREKAGEKTNELRDAVIEKKQEAQETAVKYESQEQQKQYVEARQKALEQYDANIATLKKNRDNLAGDARDRFDQRMKALDDKRDKANKALSDLKGAKPEDWKTFHDEVQRAFTELNTAYEAAGR
ncbi:MAG: hypothetical protein K8T91_12310 [Planctomycetes bacterium]|nr:hypothetical protein [Planctomycetota bacterium]